MTDSNHTHGGADHGNTDHNPREPGGVESGGSERGASGLGHTHGVADPSVLTSARGIWATKVSLVALLATAAFQVVVVVFTGSIALLADTVHNISDAATAVPLWIAFSLATRMPTKRFSYGYGRAEDLAGLIIVLVLLASGIVAGYQSIRGIFDPPEIVFLWAVAAAGLIGFLGNEAVALFRIKIGKEISSAALVADGYHARVDGLSSLAVALGAIGVWLGYPLADPIIGLVITALIFQIVVTAGKTVLGRLLDGVEPAVVDEVRQTSLQSSGVEGVSEVRVRWMGHRLRAEVNIAVPSGISVVDGHLIAQNVHHELMYHHDYLSSAIIHVDPLESSGEEHHPNAADHSNPEHSEEHDHSNASQGRGDNPERPTHSHD